MKKSVLVLSFIIITFLSFAQDTVIRLKEFSVSSFKIEKNYPITQSSIKCDSIIFLNQQKDPFFVFDKISPSIYSQSDNGNDDGYSYMRMRGMDQTRINFNLNGIPLNEMEDQGIYFSNMPGFYNYISDISIHRGVGTSKYGNTAIAGSVNMQTKDMFIKDGQISIFNMYDRFKPNFINGVYSSGDENGFAFQLGASQIENVGFKDHSNNEGKTLFYGFGYRNSKNIIKIIGFNGVSKNQLAFYGVPMDLINYRYETNLNSINDKDKFYQNFTSINWINSDKYLINNSLYFNNINGRYNTGGVYFGVNSYQIGSSSNVLIEDDRFVKNIGFNVNLYKRKHFGFDNGGYYDYPENSYRYSNTGYKNDITGYVKLTFKLNKVNLLYDFQVRNVYFSVNSKLNESVKYNWTFINPKIGIKYTLKSNNLYFSLGFTNREPTRTDIFQNIIQKNKLEFANADNINVIESFSETLYPEEVLDLELGNNYDSKLFDININLYFMRIYNEFISTGIIDSYSGFMWKAPIDKTIRYGIESNGKTKYKIFNVFYNLQYQKNSLINTEKEIPFNPDLIANCGISAKYHIEVGSYVQYIGSMAMNYDEKEKQIYSKGYYILSGYINYKMSDKMIFALNINNILNNKYYIPAGISFGTPGYYVGQLSNCKFSISYKL